MTEYQHPGQPGTEQILVDKIDGLFEFFKCHPQPVGYQKRKQRRIGELRDFKQEEKVGTAACAQVTGERHVPADAAEPFPAPDRAPGSSVAIESSATPLLRWLPPQNDVAETQSCFRWF